MCSARSALLSMWPYMTVDVVGMPTAWAVRMISHHLSTGILPGLMSFFTLSTSISAAVPGTDPSPASLSLVSTTSRGSLVFRWIWSTSAGE